jgi:hypothetical protein
MTTHAPKQDRKHAAPADAIKVLKTRDSPIGSPPSRKP